MGKGVEKEIACRLFTSARDLRPKHARKRPLSRPSGAEGEPFRLPEKRAESR